MKTQLIIHTLNDMLINAQVESQNHITLKDISKSDYLILGECQVKNIKDKKWSSLEETMIPVASTTYISIIKL